MPYKPANCLEKGCCEKAVTRGLCQKHYSRAFYRLTRTGGTWKSLEDAGLALPTGRMRLDDFAKRVVAAVTSKRSKPKK